jgi:hypothetical protein
MNVLHIILERRPEVLPDILDILEQGEIQIETINAESLTEDGILTLTVDAYDQALHLLTSHGYDTVSDEAFLTCIEDTNEAVARLASLLKQHEIEIQSMRILSRGDGTRTIAIVSSDNRRAQELVNN